MSRILVSGLVNIETTLKIEGFPIEYQPVRYPFHGVGTTVSGVGMNISKALTTLGDQTRFCSLIGKDYAGELVRNGLRSSGISSEYVLAEIENTCQSVILYDSNGRRMINTDLKDIQEREYPEERFDQALQGCALAVLCNINFSRNLLKRARQAGVWIATDVHTINDLEDAYNADFMQAAHILFMSDERLPCPPREWASRVLDRYGPEIVVIGMGGQGALLAVRSDDFMEVIPAVQVRPIVNTIGAGDALFSSFVHFYTAGQDPYDAIRKAVVFAGYKIGEKGAADGFLSETNLLEYL